MREVELSGTICSSRISDMSSSSTSSWCSAPAAPFTAPFAPFVPFEAGRPESTVWSASWQYICGLCASRETACNMIEGYSTWKPRPVLDEMYASVLQF